MCPVTQLGRGRVGIPTEGLKGKAYVYLVVTTQNLNLHIAKRASAAQWVFTYVCTV